MSVASRTALARTLTTAPVATLGLVTESDFETWRLAFRDAVLDNVGEFFATRCAPGLVDTTVDVTRDVLAGFLDSGKCVRSTFMYIGWLCRADDDEAALSAAGSLELLHVFALLQDDVMDASPLRRGRPSAHVQFADWHRGRGLSGSPERFGDSAAVLLGDLCLVWAEQMLRESGVGDDALRRAWPRYDHMRAELAIGQFADLVNDAAELPTLEHVLEVARRKSGNYTVRRPLEVGGAMADCSPRVMTRLGAYGDALGEAFQMRDDLLGVFGSPDVTGKPAGSDLSERKATSVVVAAHQLADTTTRAEMSALMDADELHDGDVERWRTLIAATGAAEWIEQLIDERITRALDRIDTDQIPDAARTALLNMVAVCTDRAA
ncbi:polyprenyl synthetase family protein [Mycolicibacterium sediminis]|uniref:Polyprenyl synthetase n=1 Tax=Mycolicibacterium sediminis TaxID=1286180 RepID=A0A7I7QSJ2_9MYCO|nr:polyprenyl synthetase family protein [Mycolicibacterium sediminis]BBY29212.1 polyprenyl synthetase [Mycolicibacterium sediminis]